MNNDTIIVMGGDGYFGWPLGLKLAVLRPQTRIIIVDNEWRRNTVRGLGSDSLLPIARLEERVKAFRQIYGQENLHFIKMDVNTDALEELIKTEQPHTIYHLAQQCSAPYSMLGLKESLFTINNNEGNNMRLLWAVRKHVPGAHIIKLGSMGEYALGGIDIAEGYFKPEYNGKKASRPMPFPRQSDDVYHTSKINDSNYVGVACRKWGLRITEVMQSTLFGNYIDEMANCEALYTRFDYDDIFGTVVNRFLTQAVVGHPLTVYGAGNQTTGIMPLRDAVPSLASIANDVPKLGEHRVINHVTQANCSINEIAQYVKQLAEAEGYKVILTNVFDPRSESHLVKDNITVAAEHIDKNVSVTPLQQVLQETFNMIKKYRDNISARVFTHHIGADLQPANTERLDVPAEELAAANEQHWRDFRDQYFRPGRVNLNPGTLGTQSLPVKSARNNAAIINAVEGNPLGMYEFGRRKLADINDLCAQLWPSPGYELMVANGTSQTINLIALNMLRAFSKEKKYRIKVITTTHEHPGGIGVFEQLPEYDVYYVEDQVLRDKRRLTAVMRLMQPDVAFISHIYYSTANFAPLSNWFYAIREAAPACKTILDVTQSVGLHDLPFGDADVVLGSAHKWLFGPHGSGLTWIKPEFHAWIEGVYWNANGLTQAGAGDQFCLQGGQDFLMYAELLEALKLYQQVGKDAVLQRSVTLSANFRKKLETVLQQQGISYTILNSSVQAPMLSVALHEYNPYDLYRALNENSIHSKCLIDHSIGDTNYHILRFGFPYYETADRLDRVIDELQHQLTRQQKKYTIREQYSEAA